MPTRRSTLARARSPRVLLLDLNMPGTPSLDAIPGFVGLSPAPVVVVLTVHDEHEFAREALAAGASAYVLKDAAETPARRGDPRGRGGPRSYLDPAIGARLAAARCARPAPTAPARRARDRLDVRGPPRRRRRRARRDGRRLPGHRSHARPPRRAQADRAEPRRGPRVPRALRARVPARGGDRPSARRPASSTPARSDGQLYVTMRYVEGTDLRELLRSTGGSSRCARRPSSPRSPARSTRRTATGSCTATSSPPTC